MSTLSTLDTAIITLAPVPDGGPPWSCFRRLLPASPTTLHSALSLFSTLAVTRNRLFPLAFLPLSASGQSRNHTSSQPSLLCSLPP